MPTVGHASVSQPQCGTRWTRTAASTTQSMQSFRQLPGASSLLVPLEFGVRLRLSGVCGRLNWTTEEGRQSTLGYLQYDKRVFLFSEVPIGSETLMSDNPTRSIYKQPT